MTTALVSTTRATSTTPSTSTTRHILHRTAGHGHGGITRLMSPGDLGDLVKPFVFLDHFEFEGVRFPELPMHPHSGLSTHTTLLEGAMTYADSTGAAGRLQQGSVEYMQAGGGVWHTGKAEGTKVRGFQLWLALPAALELTPAESHYVDVATIPGDGRVRVLLGTYEGMKSPVPYAQPVTYLHVRLRAGEAWRYQPARGHDVAWLAVSEGALRVDGQTVRREIVIFEDASEDANGDQSAIDVVAVSDVEFVIGSAMKHPHELVLGTYSVHTSAATLREGEAGIRRVAAQLKGR